MEGDQTESQEKGSKMLNILSHFMMNSMIHGKEKSVMEITLLKIVEGFINHHVTF